jgi:hypothetical protein
MSLTLMIGMFLGAIPEAAASGVMLTRVGFKRMTTFGLWSIVLVAGLLAGGAGKLFLSNPDSVLVVFAQGVAGGAVLALIAHTMIPEALHDGKSLVVLPTVGGFLFSVSRSAPARGGASSNPGASVSCANDHSEMFDNRTMLSIGLRRCRDATGALHCISSAAGRKPLL